MDTLPRTLDGRIGCRVLSVYRAAVLRFSGLLNEESLEKTSACGFAIYANYSQPWVPPFSRRNEILVKVSR